MKKIKLILTILILALFMPFMVNAETCDINKITIDSITFEEKSDNVKEIEEASANGKNINLNLSVSEVGDNIKYKITVRNDSNEEYELAENSFNLNSDYIDYSFETEDNSNIIKPNSSKNIHLIVEYKNKVPSEEFVVGKYNYNKTVVVNLSSKNKNIIEELITNPNTKSQSYIFIIAILLIISGTTYIVLKKNKKKYIILIIGAMIIIPISVYALCKCELRIESSIIITKDKKNKAIDTIKNLVINENQNNTDVITAKKVSDSCDNNLAYDGTVDNNLRYVGYNPCNYVSFNDELWRIIGVMNNVDDGTNKKETRIKIVREEALSGDYSWDSSSSDVNSGTGINDWTQSDLMNELNGDYLNYNLTENTYWYNGRNNQKTAQFDYTQGLKKKNQELIDNAKWYLGGMYYAKNSRESYLAERNINVWGSEPGQICNDGACPRTTSWVGKVALMYPSDYGFAVGDTRSLNGNRITASRSECLDKSLGAFISDYCYLNDWLWKYDSQRLLTPSTINAHSGFYIWGSAGGDDNGNVVKYYDDLTETLQIYPVVYLKENVYITNGDGSLENPYELDI